MARASHYRHPLRPSRNQPLSYVDNGLGRYIEDHGLAKRFVAYSEWIENSSLAALPRPSTSTAGKRKSCCKHLNTFHCCTNRPTPKHNVLILLSFPESSWLLYRDFQAGETGEGRLARDINGFNAPYIDDPYREAIRLFVAAEEKVSFHAQGHGGKNLTIEQNTY